MSDARVRIEATFSPRRIDSLKPEAFAYIGKRLRWRFAKFASDDGAILFADPALWEPEDQSIPVGLVPDIDLTDVTIEDARVTFERIPGTGSGWTLHQDGTVETWSEEPR